MLKTIKSLLHRLAGPIPQNEVQWVVNDLGEIGVRIRGTSYFLYKGESLVYHEPHEDGRPMMQRLVRKREFGEVCRVPGLTPSRDGAPFYFEGDGWSPITRGARQELDERESDLAAA